MIKVLVLIRVESTEQSKSIKVELPTSANVDDLIVEAAKKANWDLSAYKVQNVRCYDKDLKDYVDVERPYCDVTVENLQKYDIIFVKSQESQQQFLVNVSVDGAMSQEVLVEVPANTTLQKLIDAAIQNSGCNLNDAKVGAVKCYDNEFEEYVDVDEPYVDIVLSASDKYSINLSRSGQSHQEEALSSSVHVNTLQAPPQTKERPTTLPDSSVSVQRQPLQTMSPSQSDINQSPLNRPMLHSGGTRSPGNISRGEPINRQALGRVAQLGELYDAHRDMFCGRMLFNSNVPADSTTLTDTQRTVTDFVFGDSINDKYNKLEVEAELKASALAGLINVSGHGKYLSSSKSSDRESSASLVCRMTTKYESVNVNNQSVVSLISTDAIESTPDATHVVVGIQWGAVATATLSCIIRENTEQKQIEGQLKAKLTCIKVAAGGKGSHHDQSTTSSRNFRLQFFVDALPQGDDIPQTVEEAVEFMKKIPNLIANANGGRGTPVFYTLLPLSSLQNTITSIALMDRLISQVENRAIDEIVQMFDDIEKSGRRLTDIISDFEEYSFCLKDDDINMMRARLQLVRNTETSTRANLNRTLLDIRYGRIGAEALHNIIAEVNASPVSKNAILDFIDAFFGLKEKIAYASQLKKNKVIYIGKGESLDVERMNANCKECYVFFCDCSDSEKLADNKTLFDMLINDKDEKIPCFFVDTEVCPSLAQRENVPEGNRICHYNNGKYIHTDVFAEHIEEQNMCFVKCIDNRKSVAAKPNKRVDLELLCPQSLYGRCKKEDHEWVCRDCKEKIQYGFDEKFYCGCRAASMMTFTFRCTDEKHGHTYTKFQERDIKGLVSKLRPYKEMNILIVGETGVGKSTWINGFANYLTFASLEEATQARQVCLIPSQFSITDADYKKKIIKVGESKNESFQTGASSTQEPFAHVFQVGKRTVRLIDTPGIGDTRGADQDDRNFATILQYISHIKELHGICILMKPNNAKLNLIFKYCINELLMRLHKTAAVNIAFCFTNARSTFYRPGDSLPPLEKFLDDLKASQAVGIDLSRETIYCMDNEAFRFLCCLHAGEKFNEDERKNYANSWEVSVKETQRLLAHFENIHPHVVGETISLNDARHLILTLAKPLADISATIQLNITAINEKMAEIRHLDSKDADFAKKLMITQIGLKLVQLGFPRTVCTAMKCVDTKAIPNTTSVQTVYKTICHDKCRLSDVTPEQVPNPALQKCAAMNSNMSCKNCDCSWNLHMHITFSQENETIMVEDPDVKEAINKNRDDKETLNIWIKNQNERVNLYKKEQQKIDEVCARFGSFLKAHAILPYNDAIEDYLNLNIKEAERLGQVTGKQDTVKRLREQLKKYQEQKRVLDLSMKQGGTAPVKTEDIKKMRDELMRLPLTGGDIKKLFDATITGQQTSFQFTEQHYDQSRYHSIAVNGQIQPYQQEQDKSWWNPKNWFRK